MMKMYLLTMAVCCGTTLGVVAQETSTNVDTVMEVAVEAAPDGSSSGGGRVRLRSFDVPEDTKPPSGATLASPAGQDVTWKFVDGGDMAAQRTFPVDSGPEIYIGVAVTPVSPELSAHLSIEKNTGLVVNHVEKGSPADLAGVQQGDVLAKLNDQILILPQQLSVLVGNKKEGDSVRISILRKGQAQELSATVGKRSSESTNTGKYRIGDTDVVIDGSSGRPLRTFIQRLQTNIENEISSGASHSGPAVAATQIIETSKIEEETKKLEALLEKLQAEIDSRPAKEEEFDGQMQKMQSALDRLLKSAEQ